MGEKKTISSANQVIVCTGDQDFAFPRQCKYDRRGGECYFFYGRYGESGPYSDAVRCDCPIPIKKGEKVRVRKVYTIERIRKYRKRAPKGE